MYIKAMAKKINEYFSKVYISVIKNKLIIVIQDV